MNDRIDEFQAQKKAVKVALEVEVRYDIPGSSLSSEGLEYGPPSLPTFSAARRARAGRVLPGLQI
jgi:hypothetical protein